MNCNEKLALRVSPEWLNWDSTNAALILSRQLTKTIQTLENSFISIHEKFTNNQSLRNVVIVLRVIDSSTVHSIFISRNEKQPINSSFICIVSIIQNDGGMVTVQIDLISLIFPLKIRHFHSIPLAAKRNPRRNEFYLMSLSNGPCHRVTDCSLCAFNQMEQNEMFCSPKISFENDRIISSAFENSFRVDLCAQPGVGLFRRWEMRADTNVTRGNIVASSHLTLECACAILINWRLLRERVHNLMKTETHSNSFDWQCSIFETFRNA